MTDTPEEVIKQRTAELNATVVDLPADVGLSILTSAEDLAAVSEYSVEYVVGPVRLVGTHAAVGFDLNEEDSE